MAEKKSTFDPKEHLMSLKGKDYLQVMWRLVWFREDKPLWSIETEPVQLTDTGARFRATIKDETGRTVQTGYGSETARDFGDFYEKAETKAVGRALAMLGYGTQFTALELDEWERIVDSPAEVRKPEQKPRAQAAAYKQQETAAKPQETATKPQETADKPQETAQKATEASQTVNNPPQTETPGKSAVERVQSFVVKSRMKAESIMTVCKHYGVNTIGELTEEQAQDYIKKASAKGVEI